MKIELKPKYELVPLTYPMDAEASLTNVYDWIDSVFDAASLENYLDDLSQMFAQAVISKDFTERSDFDKSNFIHMYEQIRRILISLNDINEAITVAYGGEDERRKQDYHESISKM